MIMAKATKDITLISILSLITFVGQIALAALPNIEVVSFLLIVYTLQLGFKRAAAVSIVFTVLQVIYWGFGIWTFGYFFIWPLLTVLTALYNNKKRTALQWSIFSGLFGLSFGLLFALYSGPLFGVNIFVYWLNGIWFDVAHMIGNFFVMLLLYEPVMKAFNYRELITHKLD
jgi:energy-coupling factor transport system substrate-specific component